MCPIETKYLVRGRYWESTSPIFTLAGPKTSLERFPSKRRELAMRRKESSRDQLTPYTQAKRVAQLKANFPIKEEDNHQGDQQPECPPKVPNEE